MILEQEREFSRFFWLQRQKESILQDWRFRKKVRIWRVGVSGTTRLEEQIDIVTGDIKEASQIFGKGSMDVITTNPPYMIGGHGMANPESAKAIARHEVLCTLEDIIRESARILKAGGRFYMVHRPFRLAEILTAMCEAKLEPKRMRLVYPYVDKEPNMVLIEGIRGAKSRMTVDPPLIVYEKDGSYTREILEYYGMTGTGKE